MDADGGVEAQVEAVSDGLFEAMDVSDKRVAYGYVRRAASGCARTLDLPVGRDEGEAWYGRNTYRLGPGDYDDAALYSDAKRHLSEQGWAIEEYRGPGTVRTFLAFKGELGVIVAVPQLSVDVTGGPCGRELTVVGSQFEPVPG